MPSVLVLVLVVVLAWTVVLLPVFRHRDDALREARSFHLLSSTARVVGRRRRASGHRRYLTMPRRPGTHGRTQAVMAAEGWAPVTTSVPTPPAGGGSGPTADLAPADRAVGRGTRSGRSGSSARQLRVLLGLTALAAVQLALVFLVGPGFVVGLLISVGLLGGYLVALRRATVQRQRRRQTVARARAAHPAGTSARRRSSRTTGPGRHPSNAAPRHRAARSRPADPETVGASSTPAEPSGDPGRVRGQTRQDERLARAANG